VRGIHNRRSCLVNEAADSLADVTEMSRQDVGAAPAGALRKGRAMTTTATGDKPNSQHADYKPNPEVMPSHVDGKLSLFDRFATSTAAFVSKAWFFLACVLLVIIWAPTFAILPLDTWQLIINTVTTIITFLLVALLQNTEKRADDAVQQKLNAIANALGELMHHVGEDESDIHDCAQQLRDAVGLEQRESAG
jgi:low affinity Fe/Cu permease